MVTNRQGQTQIQKQEQRQTTSAQQILTARLTELSVEELCARINAECEDNPWLESGSTSSDDDFSEAGPIDGEGTDSDFNEESDTYAPDPNAESENDDDFPVPQQNGEGGVGDPFGSEELTFHDLLIQQMSEYELSEREQAILEYLIGSLDGDGLLRLPIDQIVDELDIYRNLSTDSAEVEKVLGILQQFDPWGVGARNLVECLLIQARRNKSLPMRSQLIRLFTEFADELNLGHWEYIQRRMKLSPAEVTAMRNSIRRLNPRPGGSVGATAVDSNHHIIPDFIVRIDEEEGLSFRLNDQHLPVVTLAEDYTVESGLEQAGITNEKIKKELDEAQRFQRKRMEEGRLFIEALAMRRHSMTVTMAAIMKLQKQFFLEGDMTLLRPMKLDDIAQLTKLDISTVSRVCRSKSVETPHGIYQLNDFFTSHVKKDGEMLSVKHIMKAIKDLVDGEDKRKPYSDDALARLLQQKGYNVARRTVAKYRIQQGIPDSRLRR